MGSKRTNKNKNKLDYMQVNQNEVMLTLGQRIHAYRHIIHNIMADEFNEIENKESLSLVLTEFDQLYQYSLDKILDSLVECSDMKLASEACNAIKKSLDIKRKLERSQNVD